ncbi:cellulose biosynthesis cyclic di-GMP-binding regulatory protein BcsB, partial [Wenyingzhuangia sp. 1_MG-2023]|nr:cellulose biosynthesis cyclic di-GMP-binding regulatory protein BcsB [Wenyingzhuangia sp. 1_MG-2023]
VPDKVVLHLEYVNSIALIGERSQLVVKLNESVVAQIPLNPARPEGIADIRLPSKRFKSGYNLISFNIVQHYESNCEDPDAPELWSQLD